MRDPLLLPVHPRPTSAFRRARAAKRYEIMLLEAKKRMLRLAAEYIEKHGPSSHPVIYELYQNLEAIRKAANGKRRRGDGWRERYLSAGYFLCLDWRDWPAAGSVDTRLS
jgi:hypothetical protein